MKTLLDVFLCFHIIGIGALLGGFWVQADKLRSGDVRVLPMINYGALTMLVTGLVMFGILEGQHEMTSGLRVKFGVKLVILVVIMALGYLNREKRRAPVVVLGGIGGLTMVNIFIAVLWHR